MGYQIFVVGYQVFVVGYQVFVKTFLALTMTTHDALVYMIMECKVFDIRNNNLNNQTFGAK